MRVLRRATTAAASATPYRFPVLVQKALELAGDVRALGAELLAAYEKGDAEHLARCAPLRNGSWSNSRLTERQNQWRDADWQVQALQKSKEARRPGSATTRT